MGNKLCDVNDSTLFMSHTEGGVSAGAGLWIIANLKLYWINTEFQQSRSDCS